MAIKRYFSDENLIRVKNDFKFLFNFVNKTYGEFDFAIRDNYFNIYYKGNSLAKVVPDKSEFYNIYFHKAFFEGTKAFASGLYLPSNLKGDYYKAIVNNKNLHSFLKQEHLFEIASKIKKRHYGEEIDFEQSLITDNLSRDDFIFIDRQITDKILRRKRLDLLALKKINGNNYQFLVCEVKLGNNKELKNKVASQLNGYIVHIKNYFNDYKYCYEKQFSQKKEFGLLNSSFNNINIIEPVFGIILVGSYSKMAESQIIELQKSYPLIQVKKFSNEM
jgi:hypothetical protein